MYFMNRQRSGAVGGSRTRGGDGTRASNHAHNVAVRVNRPRVLHQRAVAGVIKVVEVGAFPNADRPFWFVCSIDH